MYTNSTYKHKKCEHYNIHVDFDEHTLKDIGLNNKLVSNQNISTRPLSADLKTFFKDRIDRCAYYIYLTVNYALTLTYIRNANLTASHLTYLLTLALAS